MLEINSLYLTIHKTIKNHSLGVLECHEIENNNYFVIMKDDDVVFLGFQPLKPVKIVVGLNGINVLSGKDFGLKLKKGDYLLSPPQLWLDGQFNCHNYIQIAVFEKNRRKIVKIYLTTEENML